MRCWERQKTAPPGGGARLGEATQGRYKPEASIFPSRQEGEPLPGLASSWWPCSWAQKPQLSSPYLAQGEGLWSVPVEGVFERAQPGLSNANLVPQGGLLVRGGGVGVLILVHVPHSRAGKDFNGAAAEPGLPQKEKIHDSALRSKNAGGKGPARGWQNARES